VRLESALEIVGALKHRFGEPITVTDVCRAISLSYQPTYAAVQALAAQGALALRKAGQRLLCEPAATPTGSLWLAHWSVEECRRAKSSDLAELIGALESRITAQASASELVAVDPGYSGGPAVYVSDVALQRDLPSLRVEVTRRDQWAGILVGEAGDWAAARRILVISGQQLLWAVGLATREQQRAGPTAGPARLQPRRSEFVD